MLCYSNVRELKRMAKNANHPFFTNASIVALLDVELMVARTNNLKDILALFVEKQIHL